MIYYQLIDPQLFPLNDPGFLVPVFVGLFFFHRVTLFIVINTASVALM